MKREFTLVLDGVEYPIVAEGTTVTVNGRPFTVEVTPEGTVLVDGIAYSVALEEERATVEGRPYRLRVSGLRVTAAAPSHPTPSAPAPAVAGAGAVLAIMPGKITRILVQPGQQVKAGDPVCMLEAMKMENELHAKKDGVVKAVHVRPGEDVEKGRVLVEIE
ncbi:MAG: biotin/lipoyl-containing protein, partial [Anaerolineae bacterium]